MPLLWRYLVRNYLQVFALSILGFVSILLVTRFQTIAKFAIMGAPPLHLCKFILYQIPAILPLSVPISCLISSLLLLQRMSRSHELTALRASGLGLLPITFPLLAFGSLIALSNLLLLCEVAPRCRASCKNLVQEIASINPLSLLQKDVLNKWTHAHVDLTSLESGEKATNVCFITPHLSNQRLGIIMAEELSVKQDQLVGQNITFISSIPTQNPQGFDHLLIENQVTMQICSSELSHYLRNVEGNMGYECLNLRMLQTKCFVEKGRGLFSTPPAFHEAAKRISLALATITFTFVGVCFGLETSRKWSIRGVLYACSLITFYLIALICAKSVKHSVVASLSLLFFPHLIISIISLRYMVRFKKGYL